MVLEAGTVRGRGPEYCCIEKSLSVQGSDGVALGAPTDRTLAVRLEMTIGTVLGLLI